MIELIADIPKVNFLSTIPDLKLNFDGVRLQVKFFLLEKDGTEVLILSEPFYKNFQDVVEIKDLSNLLEPYAENSLSSKFKYELVEDRQDPVVREFSILYSKSEVDITAEQFASNYYLTHMQGAKELYPDIPEYLHFVCTEPVAVKAHLVYDVDGELVESAKELTTVSTINELVTLDVSPSKFEVPGQKLIEFTIQTGSRIAKYYLNHDSTIRGTTFLFTNSFGCQEVFTCRGVLEQDTKFTREAGIVSGEHRNYSVEEEKVYQCNTGGMDVATANWAEDLLRGEEIYLLDDRTVGKAISIVDSKSIRSNQLGSFDSYTLTYRLSQRNHNILKLREGGRVFDHTFDLTFN